MKKEIYSELKKITGIAVPLGALRTRNSPVIGEFSSLIDFIPFCKKSGIELIQLLPVNDSGTQSSPYSALSAFALHPLYISISRICFFKELYASDSGFAADYDAFIKKYAQPLSKKINRYEYDGINCAKAVLLKKVFLFAFSDAAETGGSDASFSEWIEQNPWVKSYAVFKALKEKYLQSSWKSWPEDEKKAEVGKRWEKADAEMRKNHLFYAWCQFEAFKQFSEAAAAVKDAEIILKGDMPILMNEDSCDAWEHRDVFNHSLRAGSPPDFDNPMGQNWGFPIYNWEQLKKNQYAWWKARLNVASQFYSAYRLDHILGFYRIWAVPENDTTAVLGHTEPCVPFTRAEIESFGFDEGRIHWLSEPHIPTKVIEDITWNHENACKILNLVADRVGTEELWNFKKTLSGDKEIFAADFKGLCTADAEKRIKNTLSEYWRDRCIIQLKKDEFVFSWLYKNSTAWKSLSAEEQQKLQTVYAQTEQTQNELWKSNALEILQTLTSSVAMIPCGEDLGVSLSCVPSVMFQCGILGLRVVRWSREWEKETQPYIPMEKYTPLSVTTTSVHDSSTIRQWWETEKDSVKAFITAFPEKFGISSDKKPDSEEFSQKISSLAETPFTPETARAVLEKAAQSESVWCIHPLQDFLYLEKKYYLEESADERINIPGTVTPFNWTYMLPAFAEDLAQDKKLCASIADISRIHKGGSL